MSPEPINIDLQMDMPVVEVSADVVMVDGKPELKVENRSRWLTALAREKGRRVTVTVTRFRLRRSTKANAFLWAMYTELLGELQIMAGKVGEQCPFQTKEALHEAMKRLFIGVDMVKVGGVEMESGSTSTVLDIEQFSRFTSNIKRLAAERWQIFLSEPE